MSGKRGGGRSSVKDDPVRSGSGSDDGLSYEERQTKRAKKRKQPPLERPMKETKKRKTVVEVESEDDEPEDTPPEEKPKKKGGKKSTFAGVQDNIYTKYFCVMPKCGKRIILNMRVPKDENGKVLMYWNCTWQCPGRAGGNPYDDLVPPQSRLETNDERDMLVLLQNNEKENLRMLHERTGVKGKPKIKLNEDFIKDQRNSLD